MGSSYQKIKKEICYRNTRPNQGYSIPIPQTTYATKFRTRSEKIPHTFGNISVPVRKIWQDYPQVKIKALSGRKVLSDKMVIGDFTLIKHK